MHLQVKRVLKPKRYRRSEPAPLPMLRRKDGTVCATLAETLDAWRSHFAGLEDGIVSSPRDLVSACCSRQQTVDWPDSLFVADLPTFGELELALRRSAPGKAAGPDLLPPALLRCFSPDAADLLWPLLLKLLFRGEEPAGFKGGTLHCIPKPIMSGYSTLAMAFAASLSKVALLKLCTGSVRHLAVGRWLTHAPECQIGGKKGCSADVGHFMSRAFMHFAHVQGLSCAVVFLDLVSA